MQRDRELIRELIRECCPSNWGDEESSARVWIKAEKACGEKLPDADWTRNVEARKRLNLK